MKMSRRHLLAAGIAIAAMPKPTFAAEVQVFGRPVPELAAFDNAMRDLSMRYNIPAGALAMTYRGRLVLSRSYSLGGEFVQPDSPFRLASVSKAITAIATMRAWQDGLIQLSAPVRSYLDMQPTAGQKADPRLDRVTVSDLLYHTGGLPTAYDNNDPLFSDVAVSITVDKSMPVNHQDIIRYTTGLPMESEPGTRYSYSNYGYLLLGRIIEATTGMSYERYVQQVLARIGISRMQLARPLESQRAPGEVRYFGSEETMYVYDESGRIVPAHYGGYNTNNNDANGGWIASAIDLTRILTTLESPSNALLGTAAMQEMYAVPPIGKDPDGSWHGRGWIVRPGVGSNIAGSLPGTSSLIERRENGVTWAAVWNQREIPNAIAYQMEMATAVNEIMPSITRWPDHDLYAEQRLFSTGYSGL